jgi:DNA polymerase-3 subunit alpha
MKTSFCSGAAIRFGLTAVKNVGDGAAESIVAGRAQGPYADLNAFCGRVDLRVVNKKVVESLVKAGALDSTGSSRKGMLDVLEHALSYGQTKQADRAAGQASIFDEAPDGQDVAESDFFAGRNWRDSKSKRARIPIKVGRT